MSSITAIMSSATSALATNQAALATTSANVANVNNPDYVRRQVQLASLNVGGETVGVEVAEVNRIAAQFLQSQVLSSHGTAGTLDAMSDIQGQIQSVFGAPDDPTSMPSLVNEALSYPSELTLDPVSTSRRMAYLQSVQSALDSISRTSTQVQTIRANTDSTIATDVSTANNLISSIYDLNGQIVKAKAVKADSSALEDQRDSDLRQLSDLISIKTYTQPNGSMTVTTDDGFSLIGDSKVQLTYQQAGQSGTDVVYDPIMVQSVNPNTGAPMGQPAAFDSHIDQGALRGLLTMRDTDLPNLLQQLGNLAGNFSDQLNAAHNDSVAVPPPNTLTGSQTGLLSSDDAGFSGQTTLCVVNADGTLAHSLTFDFSAGTYTIDNTTTAAIPNGAGASIGDVLSVINSTGFATADLTNGVLTLSADDPSAGIGFSQPETNGSSRGGRSFSQFFGLNDLVRADRPSNFDVAFPDLSNTQGNFTAGQAFTLKLTDSSGKLLKQFTYTASGSETLQDVVNAINDPTTGLGQYITLNPDGNGGLAVTQVPGSPVSVLDVDGDNTDRGGTGVSFTAMFGIGRRYQMEQASDLQINPSVANNAGNLALAHLDFDASTAPGDVVAAVADSTGAQALANLATNKIGFDPAGDIRATVSSIGDYASLVVGNASSNAAAVTQMQSAADSVKDEVESRRSSIEGVNLDEELSNMIIYQQAYSAAARLVTVAKDLYDTLINQVQ